MLVHRERDGYRQVLLVHPGGPYWRKRDDGSWSIPKGEFSENEEAIDVARREFEEELGVPAPVGTLNPLDEIRQPGGKIVHAWAVAGDIDVARVRSNTFEIEWPPRSGRKQQFPEVDRAGWFDLDSARRKLLPAQREFIDRLEAML